MAVSCQTSPDERLSSTSISAGNPVGLTFHIERNLQPIAFTGTFDIYAANQIPVPGYRPDPLLRMHLDHADSVYLDTSAITAIPYMLWRDTLALDQNSPDTIVWDSADGTDTLLQFNVVMTGDTLGAIIKGFGFDKRSRRFILPPGIAAESAQTVHAPLSKLVDYVGQLPSANLSLYKNYFLFIFGTGYVAKGMSDPKTDDMLLFSITKLPEGEHGAFLTSLPKKEHLLSGSDVTDIFYLESPLRTGTDSLERGLRYKTMELPDSLKVK